MLTVLVLMEQEGSAMKYRKLGGKRRGAAMEQKRFGPTLNTI
jgi:hypothetical protein